MKVTYTPAEKAAITRAKNIIASKGACYSTTDLTSPQAVRDYIKLHLAPRTDREYFTVIYLSQRHGVINSEDVFAGTIDGASVYPREVMRRALEEGAAAIIVAHNHPSGVSAEPSQADVRITKRLKDAAQLLDIRLLDHVIVAGDHTYSFAEHGGV